MTDKIGTTPAGKRMIDKVMKKREASRIRKEVSTIIGGIQERPGRSNPRVITQEAVEKAERVAAEATISVQDGPPVFDPPKEWVFPGLSLPIDKHTFATLFSQPTTNLAARERLERQISDLMTKVSQGVRIYNNETKDALDLLEIARGTAYTEPLGEVSVTIMEASRRLDQYFPWEAGVVKRLAKLALDIAGSEAPEKEE